MTLLSFLCDLLGLAVMCILAVTIAASYSLLRLLMAGFLRSAVCLLTRSPGILRLAPVLNLKILKKNNKSWLTMTLGRVTLAAAIAEEKSGSSKGVLLVQGDGDTVAKEVES